jgi:hypothetical protein
MREIVSLDWVLFALRILSAAVLIAILAVMFFFMWRDMRGTMQRNETTRRIYGRMIGMIQFDDSYTPTGEVYPLRAMTTLGRAPTSSVVLKDAFASSEHASITLRDGRWWLEDRNSRNGTILNGDPLTSPVIITDGDIITIGNTHFRIVLNSEENAT